ncbi:hypothetical protein [Oceanithermus sp.]
MRARYVVTTTCLKTGTISLTRSLREMLSGKERVQCVDEDGETLDCNVNWVSSVVEGLAPYFEKRRLQVNDVIWLTYENEKIALEAAAARKVRPRPLQQPAQQPAPPARVEEKVPVVRERSTPVGEAGSGGAPPKRVRVTGRNERRVPARPAHVLALEKLELKHQPAENYDVFRAYLGRREYSLALGRYGEAAPADMLELRRTRRADYAALLVPEAQKSRALAELGGSRVAVVTPEALERLVSLKKLFPVGPVELERLLKKGNVDLETVAALAEEVRRWVGERAVFSAVLLALAEYNRQQVFYAEDVLANIGEGQWEPDQVRAVLEALCGPPFLLLERQGIGEYLLREPVADNLAHLAEYALSLRNRIIAD